VRALLPAVLLALACTGSTDPTDAPADTDDTDALAQPDLGPAPPLPSSGWVRVQGVVELAEPSVQPEPFPDLVQIIGTDPDWEVYRETLCEGTDQAYRQALFARVDPSSSRPLSPVDPARCDGPAFCDWALDTLQAHQDVVGTVRAALEDRILGCPSHRALAHLQSLGDPELLADALLRDSAQRVPITPEVLAVLIDRVEEGQPLELGWFLVGRPGLREHRRELQQILARRHAGAPDPIARDILGRARGLFADGASQRAWRSSCHDAEAQSCAATWQSGLDADAEPGTQVLPITTTASDGVHHWIARVRSEGADHERITQELLGCLRSPTTWWWSHGQCLDLLVQHQPEALAEHAEALLRGSAVVGPSSRRRLTLAARDTPALDTLVELGLLPSDHGLPPPEPGADPVEILVQAGVAVRAWSSSTDALSPRALTHRLAWVAGLGPLRVLATGPDRTHLRIWLDGERFSFALIPTPDGEGAPVDEIVGALNAIAEHRDHPARLLLQPGQTWGYDLAVVAAPADVLERSVQAGVLSGPVPDAAHFERASVTARETAEPGSDTGSF